jgi:malic enzyme
MAVNSAVNLTLSLQPCSLSYHTTPHHITPHHSHHATGALAGEGAARDLARVVAAVQPTALIGAASVGGAFTRAVVRAMCDSVHAAAGQAAGGRGWRRPVVFALSNPTSRAECSAEQAWEWSLGRAVYASGVTCHQWGLIWPL